MRVLYYPNEDFRNQGNFTVREVFRIEAAQLNLLRVDDLLFHFEPDLTSGWKHVHDVVLEAYNEGVLDLRVLGLPKVLNNKV